MATTMKIAINRHLFSEIRIIILIQFKLLFVLHLGSMCIWVRCFRELGIKMKRKN